MYLKCKWNIQVNHYTAGGYLGQYKKRQKTWINERNQGTWVLIWGYSSRDIQWIPTWQGLDGFQKSLSPFTKVASASEGLKKFCFVADFEVLCHMPVRPCNHWTPLWHTKKYFFLFLCIIFVYLAPFSSPDLPVYSRLSGDDSGDSKKLSATDQQLYINRTRTCNHALRIFLKAKFPDIQIILSDSMDNIPLPCTIFVSGFARGDSGDSRLSGGNSRGDSGDSSKLSEAGAGAGVSFTSPSLRVRLGDRRSLRHTLHFFWESSRSTPASPGTGSFFTNAFSTYLARIQASRILLEKEKQREILQVVYNLELGIWISHFFCHIVAELWLANKLPVSVKIQSIYGLRQSHMYFR